MSDFLRFQILEKWANLRLLLNIEKPFFSFRKGKERKKALNLVKRHPTRSNLEHYRIIRAKTRRIMKSSKRQSWQSFVSKINNRTPLKKGLVYDP